MFEFHSSDNQWAVLVIIVALIVSYFGVLSIINFNRSSIWERKHKLLVYLCKYFPNTIQMCQPLRTLDDLLNFHRNPVKWVKLVEPLRTRSRARTLSTYYEDLEYFGALADDPLKRKILVCHDFKGNYREDSYINGSEKWDGYRFYNWYGIDYFCYFSHELVSIVPLQWINASHKHGVICLGTFIVESNRGRRVLEQILENEDQMKRVADALVLVSRHCNFDGWLLNIECSLPADKIQLLVQFVEYLTKNVEEQVPNGKVLWYDSITVKGNLLWQNELNQENKVFFEKSHGIFLNYAWTPDHLNRTSRMVDQLDISRFKDVFVGIDIFGRGQVAKFQTHETLEKIPETLSVALFATGWTLESVESEMAMERQRQSSDEINERFLRRNEQFWSSLWPQLRTYGPTELPFYSSFCLGSGKYFHRLGMRVRSSPFFNLSKMGLQLSIPGLKRDLDDAFNGGSCVVVKNRYPQGSRLLVCEFEGFKRIVIAFAFKRCHESVDVALIIRVHNKARGGGTFLRFVSNEERHSRPYHSIQMMTNDREIQSLEEQFRNRREKCLPGVRAINGWEIRYFQVEFDSRIRAILTDVGMEVLNPLRIEDPFIKLGALAIHKADSIGQSEIYTITSM